MSFHKQIKTKVVHFQIDNTTALMYLLKMGGGGEGGGGAGGWNWEKETLRPDQGYIGL